MISISDQETSDPTSYRRIHFGTGLCYRRDNYQSPRTILETGCMTCLLMLPKQQDLVCRLKINTNETENCGTSHRTVKTYNSVGWEKKGGGGETKKKESKKHHDSYSFILNWNKEIVYRMKDTWIKQLDLDIWNYRHDFARNGLKSTKRALLISFNCTVGTCGIQNYSWHHFFHVNWLP